MTELNTVWVIGLLHFLVNIQQLFKVIVQFSLKNLLNILPSVSIKVFISIKTSPREGNLSTEKIRNSGAQFFCASFWNFRYYAPTSKKRVPRDTFFRNHEPNRVLEMSLSYWRNKPISYPSEKYKLSIRSFL